MITTGRPNSFIREVKIKCGPSYQAVEIFPYSDRRTEAARKKRKTKTVLSTPAQQNLNDKRSRRYLQQLILTNFGPGDMIAHPTYSDRHKPESWDAAQKNIKRWISRINYACKKRGLPAAKYICITPEGAVHNRIHHHVFLSCGLERDEIESMWWASKGSRTKPPDMLGGINVDRLKDWNGK